MRLHYFIAVASISTFSVATGSALAEAAETTPPNGPQERAAVAAAKSSVSLTDSTASASGGAPAEKDVSATRRASCCCANACGQGAGAGTQRTARGVTATDRKNATSAPASAGRGGRVETDGGTGARPGPVAGAGPARRRGGEMAPVMSVFHQLLTDHAKIKRTVEDVPGGVVTVTTSSGVKVTEASADKDAALLIRQHARRGVSEFVARGWDRAHEKTPLPEGYGGD